jgi:spermidine synthase
LRRSAAEAPLSTSRDGALARAVGLLFFGSGAAGLVYQVLWMRSLGLLFGSDIAGVSIVLGTFMGGMALGHFAGGLICQRLAKPLVAYGLAELGIGLSALLFPSLLRAAEIPLGEAYRALGPESAQYQLLRVALSAGALLIPTGLMGATLPLVLRHFARDDAALGKSGGGFYAANTLGALCGTLLVGFVLLPQLGMARSNACAAALNLAIGASCVAIGWSRRAPEAGDAARRASAAPEANPLCERSARAAILAYGLSGAGSFALEVVWTRVLLQTTSATVYAFAAMLACTLLGIALGSAWAARRIDAARDALLFFARIELAAAAAVAALGALSPALPPLFASLLRAFASSLEAGAALTAATLAAGALLVLPPALLLGASFPAALRAAAPRAAHAGPTSGWLGAANTLGAIAGSLAGAFLLLPALGARGSLAAISLLFAAIGLGLLVARGASLARALAEPAQLAMLASAGALGTLSAALPYRPTLNFHQRASASIELLYHAEGAQSTIDVVRSQNGTTSLVIGGNVEADDSETQRRHFVLKAHLPLLFLPEPKRVLVIGLGMGITLRSTLRHPGVEQIDVVELSREIAEAQRLLREINGDVLSEPRVKLRIDDGRSFMRYAHDRFDMISADPIHPKVSRVGTLYTEEYYADLRARLAEGGVVCQWMPLYQISPSRLRSAVASFAAVFPEATLWYVKNHALFVARGDGRALIESAADWERLRERIRSPEVSADLAPFGFAEPEALFAQLLLGPDEIRAFAASEASLPRNTDDYPYLEYFVPADLNYVPRDNLRELLRFESGPSRALPGLPADVAQRLRERARGRAERWLAELERS